MSGLILLSCSSIISSENGFKIYPIALTPKASYAYSLNPVTKIILISGLILLKRFASSIPDITGISISKNATSTVLSTVYSSASAGFEKVFTLVTKSKPSQISFISARTRLSSSTAIIFIYSSPRKFLYRFVIQVFLAEFLHFYLLEA